MICQALVVLLPDEELSSVVAGTRVDYRSYSSNGGGAETEVVTQGPQPCFLADLWSQAYGVPRPP